jgi:hypothetical protein
MEKPSQIEWLIRGRKKRNGEMGIDTVLISTFTKREGRSERSELLTRQWIPYGAAGWGLPGETTWRAMDTLPPECGLVHHFGL